MSKLVTQDDLYTIMQAYDDRLDALGLAARSTVPIGGIILWPVAVAVPEGWLVCNGSAFDPAVQPFLFNVLGDDNVPTLVAPAGSKYIIKT